MRKISLSGNVLTYIELYALFVENVTKDSESRQFNVIFYTVRAWNFTFILIFTNYREHKFYNNFRVCRKKIGVFRRNFEDLALYRNSITWFIRKQQSIALLSCEADYIRELIISELRYSWNLFVKYLKKIIVWNLVGICKQVFKFLYEFKGFWMIFLIDTWTFVANLYLVFLYRLYNVTLIYDTTGIIGIFSFVVLESRTDLDLFDSLLLGIWYWK